MKFKRLSPALLVAGALLLAGCGSDDSSSGSGGGGSGSSQSADNTPEGPPIKVGTICTCSGAQGTGLAGVRTLAEAWVRYTNKNGGLNGHPVELVFLDDKGDATTSAQRARELVEEKVVAIVGNFSQQQDAWADIVTKAGIPVVGAPGQSPAELQSPNWFPVGSNPAATSFQQLKRMAADNKTKLATMYCTESPVCKQLKGVVAGFLQIQKSPIKVVSSSDVSASQPSYAPNCLAAKEAGANATVIFQAQAVGKRVIQQCKQQAWEPTLYGANGSASHNDESGLPAGGVVLTLPTLGIDDRTTPGGKKLGDIMAAEAPELEESDVYTENLGAPYAGFELFGKVAETAKLRPTSTPNDVKEGLWALKDETLGGLTAPLNFEKDKPTFNGCTFYTTWKDGQWKAGTEPACMTDEEKAAVGKLFSEEN